MTSAPEKQRRLRGAGRYRGAAPAVAHRERMKAAATAVQALVGAGELVIQGRRAWVIFTLEKAVAGFERVQQLVARGQLDVCRSATGARCIGPGWARVRHAGMVLDIFGAVRTGDGKCQRAAGPEVEAWKPQMDTDTTKELNYDQIKIKTNGQ